MKSKHDQFGGHVALDGYTDQTLSRQARAAEFLDSETETRLARAWPEPGAIIATRRPRTDGSRPICGWRSRLPRTLASLVAGMGLSKERIRQMEAAAYVRMKRALKGHAGALNLFLSGRVPRRSLARPVAGRA